MFAILALASAVLYGAADFVGGFTSKHASAVAVVLVSQLAGLAMVAGVLPFLGTPAPGQQDWWWGAVAGLAGGIGVALLYRALAIGTMAVVAPVTAVCAVLVPVATAVFLGERPGPQATAGIGLALVGILLVSQSDAAHHTTGRLGTGIGLALAAGFAIGLFFVALANTSPEAGLWPLVSARIASVSFFGLVAAVAKTAVRMNTPVALTAAAGGVLDMTANLMYLLATRVGPLTLVVTLSSLYPASTVLLARVVLHERITRRQWAGIACALVAIIAILTS